MILERYINLEQKYIQNNSNQVPYIFLYITKRNIINSNLVKNKRMNNNINVLPYSAQADTC